MDPIPYLVFLATGGLMVAVQTRYFAAVAERPGSRVTPLTTLGERIRARPGRLIHVVARETSVRLRALLTRQDEVGLERDRRLACVAGLPVILSFLLIVTSSGPGGR